MTFNLIDKYIRKTLEASGIPGLSIGITNRRRSLWIRTYGHAELESNERVTPETLFEIGSISKFFSSIVLMQLSEEGLVDIESPVTNYLPWFKVRSRYGPITLHHLLTHTAGLVTGQEESPEGVSEVWSLRGTETGSPPGEHFHYSNHGYKTVGLVMERVTGKPVGRLVSERILRPLRMDSTEPVITNSVRSRLAVGYTPFMDDRPFVPGAKLSPATWFESGTADGTICSTPEDMCKHLRMLLKGGAGPKGRLVSRESFARLTAPHIRPDDGTHGESYGYGMNVGKLDGHACLWHTGGMVGFHASIVVDTDSGIGVVTMVNGPGVPEDVSFFALKAVRSSMDGTRLPPMPPIKRVKDIENVEEFAGAYSSKGAKLRVVSSGKALWMVRGGKKLRLVPLGQDRFCAEDQEFLYPISFGRQKGEVVELFHGDEWLVNSRYRGRGEFPVRSSWRACAGHFRSNSPWLSNLRVVLRKGQLALIRPYGEEEPLVPLKDGSFRVGSHPSCPERIRFEMIVNGKAHLAVLSAGRYYRTFTE